MPGALTRPIVWAGTRREYVILEGALVTATLFLTRFHLVSFALAATVALLVHPLLVLATKWDEDFLHVLYGHLALHASWRHLVAGSPRAFIYPPTAEWHVVPTPVPPAGYFGL